MPSEFIQRQTDRLLGQAEEAIDANDWGRVADLATRVQSIDPENTDAHDLLTLAVIPPAMPSERVQRQIDRLLDEAEQAAASDDWDRVRDRATRVLAIHPGHDYYREYIARAAGLEPAVVGTPYWD